MSVAADVATTAKTLIDALALTAPVSGSALSAVIRKTPTLPHGTTDGIVIVVGEEGEIEYLTAEKIHVRYPLTVVLATSVQVLSASAGQLGDTSSIRTRRQTIRRALDDDPAWKAAVPAGWAADGVAFDTIDSAPRTPFHPTTLEQAGVDYSVLYFVVQVTEPRND